MLQHEWLCSRTASLNLRLVRCQFHSLLYAPLPPPLAPLSSIMFACCARYMRQVASHTCNTLSLATLGKACLTLNINRKPVFWGGGITNLPHYILRMATALDRPQLRSEQGRLDSHGSLHFNTPSTCMERYKRRQDPVLPQLDVRSAHQRLAAQA